VIEEYDQNPTETIKASEFEQKKQKLYISRQGYQNNKVVHRKVLPYPLS